MQDEEAIQRQLALLAAHRQTLSDLARQAAHYGGEIFAPPETANGLASARTAIAQTKRWLRDNGVKAEDQPDDEPPPSAEPVTQTVKTGGGDYSEGNIDKRQGTFVKDSVIQGSVIEQQLVANFTGEVLFKLWLEAPEKLSQNIYTTRFRTFIHNKTEEFVGREFILSWIDSWLSDDDFRSGYVAIIGSPGIGKSTLLAQLIQERGYVHHFNIASEGIRSFKAFLRNICAQLIVRYRLNYSELPREVDEDSGFLSLLLAEAAAAQPPGQPIIIAVDALDEAEDTGLPPRANRLYLPESLPDNVYFVVSTRPKFDFHLKVDRFEPLHINNDDPQNLDDVKLFIQRFIQKRQARMERRLAEWQVTEEEFCKVLTNKSEGNFLYLVLILRDIASGKLTAANIDRIKDLPQGLRNYYVSHWDIMQLQLDKDFHRYYQPIVCLLAAAQEPVTSTQLQEWTQIDHYIVQKVLNAWLEFLNVQEFESGTKYRVYHASFRDFLHEYIGLQNSHSSIAQTAINKIPQWG